MPGLLVLRMAQLQVVEYEHFSTLSEDNRVKIVPLAPTRGLIYDRNGVRAGAEHADLHPRSGSRECRRHGSALLAELGQLVEITPEDTADRFRGMLKKKRPFQSVPLRYRLDEEEVARFSVNRHRFPGADVHARLTRSYPLGASAVHLLGYVASMNEEDLQSGRYAAEYRGTTHIGKTGVEQAYESLLHGKPGFQHVETNAQGRILRVLERSDPVPGQQYLSDHRRFPAGGGRACTRRRERRGGGGGSFHRRPAGLRQHAGLRPESVRRRHRLEKLPCSLLASRSGRCSIVPSMVSIPRAPRSSPSSDLAGLELEHVGKDHEVFCPGWFRLPGRERRYRDWKKWGHGKVDVTRSIVQSCDVYYYALAQKMGISRCTIILPSSASGSAPASLQGESAGLMPSPDWKRRSKGQAWFPGETLITGIGQGFTLATPLQLAMATADAQHPRCTLRPQVVLGVTTRRPEQHRGAGAGDTGIHRGAPGSQLADDHQRHGRCGARPEEARRGASASAPPIASPARPEPRKSSASPRTRNTTLTKLDKKLHGPCALFIAFAPVDNPRIAVAVLVENGGSGSKTAAPIARKVMDHYFQQVLDEDDEQLILTAV